MASEINNVKCAQQMLKDMENIDFPTVREVIYGAQWISIKDKPAPFNEMIIVYDSSVKRVFLHAFFQGFDYDYSKITHWMPLPDAPSST